MALNDIIKQQVSNAFTNILGPGGLTESVTMRYYVSAGTYNVEEDTIEDVYNNVPEVIAVVSKPGFDDHKDHGALFTDAKLLIPGPFLPSEPQADTDKVIRRINNVDEEWDIRKVVGVPGSSLWIVFIYRT